MASHNPTMTDPLIEKNAGVDVHNHLPNAANDVRGFTPSSMIRIRVVHMLTPRPTPDPKHPTPAHSTLNKQPVTPKSTPPPLSRVPVPVVLSLSILESST